MSDTRDPITAYLSMHVDLIREADSDLGARLSARGAEGYLQALYDLQRIQPGTYSQHIEEITRLKAARIAELEGKAAALDREIRAIEEDMRNDRDE
ncbi:hypothetical protein [Pseudomonas fragi]|uniref:hypothetical protein n=1 Tax=Pseudomonas fragi TaxID=296 RepID=UPI001474FA95|nr:hypothetical protein [Pseudomonas fragi]NNB33890.1 hypothetical protein [Pseudomonas fragi]